MKIGIIGSGHIGGTLAKRFADAGHEVVVSNSRGPDTLASLVEQLGAGARATLPAEAARFGELVVVSVPFGRYREVPAEGVAGKVVIDTHNYYPQRDGHFEELDSDRTTSSELLQTHLADARVVKAFNAIVWTRLRDDGRPAGDDERIGIPISGDDQEAKQTVAELIDEIGFDAVDAGTLAEGGRKHQAGAPAYTEGLPTAELRARLDA
ncbi:MAG: 8-hydroxy-5-deazaflavin:NADPH oxidoreductase [Solirubrobacteraceae bacterium]|nr:8-hydroxy-5-deazaflavin:NADPH oxidoreductase [Solirubrobacteraceae bacterium]